MLVAIRRGKPSLEVGNKSDFWSFCCCCFLVLWRFCVLFLLMRCMFHYMHVRKVVCETKEKATKAASRVSGI